MHRRHTLVEDLRSHQLDAGHDLLLVAHQRHPEPLHVPEGGEGDKKIVKQMFQALNKHLFCPGGGGWQKKVCRDVSKVKVIVCQLYFNYKQFDCDPDGSKF